jgi:methyl-accepting chemotaxis protein
MANNIFDDFKIENIAKEVQKCVDVVAEKTDEAFKGSRNYVQRVQSTTKLSALYEKLGKAHYMTASGQSDQRKEIAELMEQISDIQDEIDESTVSYGDNSVRCSVCKKKNPPSSKFCARCGAKLGED